MCVYCVPCVALTRLLLTCTIEYQHNDVALPITVLTDTRHVYWSVYFYVYFEFILLLLVHRTSIAGR
jgi:hypothetical protein